MPARLVAAVAVVIGGEEVAEFVEGQLLWIAQSPGNHLEFGSVRIRAEDAAGIGQQLGREPGDGILDLREQIRVRAAVGNGPIQLAVRSQDQPVHVMSAEGDVDAEASEKVSGFELRVSGCGRRC
jgi:hypothetical protein